jgi:large subunit ribosomal protein L16
MLQPKRTKFRKEHRGRMKGMAIKGSHVAFGEFGLKSLGSGWVTSRQIEAGRRAITRHLRRGGQVWIRIFPAKPITHKPLEVRQGGGKGPVEAWVAIVKPGRIMYEVGGVPPELAKSALARAAQKLPLKTRTVSRDEKLAVAVA